jgi:hypothetical protein
MIFYEPGSRDRTLLPQDPFKALVVPRHIGWISTTGSDGSVNLENHIIGSDVDTLSLRPIARCGGPGDYTLVEHIFEMLRPRS